MDNIKPKISSEGLLQNDPQTDVSDAIHEPHLAMNLKSMSLEDLSLTENQNKVSDVSQDLQNVQQKEKFMKIKTPRVYESTYVIPPRPRLDYSSQRQTMALRESAPKKPHVDPSHFPELSDPDSEKFRTIKTPLVYDKTYRIPPKSRLDCSIQRKTTYLPKKIEIPMLDEPNVIRTLPHLDFSSGRQSMKLDESAPKHQYTEKYLEPSHFPELSDPDSGIQLHRNTTDQCFPAGNAQKSTSSRNIEAQTVLKVQETTIKLGSLHATQLSPSPMKNKNANKSTALTTNINSQIASPVIFPKLQIDYKDIVTFVQAINEDRFPKLKNSGKLLSKVYHLLPHGYIFKSPIHVGIRIDKHLEHDSQIVVFYSATTSNERPHWELLTYKNKSNSEFYIVNIDSQYCTVSMPTFCEICVAQIQRGQLQNMRPEDDIFDRFVGILFENDYRDNRWLVKVRVLFSETKFTNRAVRKADKFQVVSHGILGATQVQIRNIKNGWRFDSPDEFRSDDPNKPSTTITEFKLKFNKQKEVVFCFVSDTATANDIFCATVRLHQEQALMDCELILADACILANMVSRTRDQVQGSYSYPISLCNGGQSVSNQSQI